MNYVKIYNNTKKSPEKFLIGIINAKLVESIEWYRRPASTEAGGQEYQIHGSYYGSSADVDFSLNLPMIMNSFIYDTDEKRARVMNIICDGMTKACQATFTTPGQTVIDYYPPLDIGNDFVIETNPFQPQQQIGEPSEGFEKGMIEEGPGFEFEKGELEGLEPAFG